MTENIDVTGIAKCERLAMTLIADSTPFSIEPLPDDVWRFTVKSEAAARLAKKQIK